MMARAGHNRGRTLVSATAVLALLMTLTGLVRPNRLSDPRAELATTINAILDDPRLEGALVGVVVADAETGERLYARAADQRQLPASNMKLFTSAAALEVLGPDHRFTTTVASTGVLRRGILSSDLYLRGTGDPTLRAADLQQLANAVAEAGIRVVTGDLVIDDTFFDAVPLGTEWGWDDEPLRTAAQVTSVPVTPTGELDPGSLAVIVRPAATVGAAPTVTTDPPTGRVVIINRATTGAAGSATTLSVTREHGTNHIVITGSTPLGGAEVRRYTSLEHPSEVTADVFRTALTQAGVRVIGDTVTGVATPPDVTVYATRESVPLIQLLPQFLKLSKNTVAEILMKAMGRAAFDQGSWPAGRQAAAEALAAWGVDMAVTRIMDGSGLSRRNLIAPAQITALLLGVQDEPWFPAWYAALPIAGRDGTLAGRMRQTVAEGNVHAKTGTLTAVSTLSGYVTNADGERLVFSVMFNNYLSGAPTDLQDRIAVALAEYDPTPEDPASRTAELTGDRYRPAAPQGRAGEVECSWIEEYDACAA